MSHMAASEVDADALDAPVSDGVPVTVHAAGITVKLPREFTFRHDTGRIKLTCSFETSDRGDLRLTALESSPALSLDAIDGIDWRAVFVDAFRSGSDAMATVDAHRSEVSAIEAVAGRRTVDMTGAQLAAVREVMDGPRRNNRLTPEMLARALQIYDDHGIRAVQREFNVGERSAFRYVELARKLIADN